MKIELSFRLEVDHGRPLNTLAPDGWREICQDSSKLYLEGLAEGWAVSLSPRSAVRLVRAKDKKVLRVWPASDAPNIGAVAGWPTTAQCLHAADRALRQVPSKDAHLVKDLLERLRGLHE